MGEQMQVDFGEVKIKNMQGISVKLWFITFVLSHSRHKFVHWQDRPFVTKDVIDAHELAFVYYGGMTREIVYDQDHLLLASENYGDLILTHELHPMYASAASTFACAGNRIPKARGVWRMS
ncbi:transposase [Paenibacillus sp. JMULE4]|uniref:DDE-type integrase/transposase/recombinase n=1 Tax=Paenibacillus sp. JMULE4 TaxID=2518342 RepID=UPI001C2D34E2|nr:DDE-type integrase/transposase/recombinase [Paenibacillus sp. JMULE4]NTZ20040.1 transposase [Paenibacillus sp. JMULE4]